MTNPNNAIGTNGAYSGRTSPEALNDVATAYSRGIISGWNCAPSTGMKVALGGTAGTRDVAIATDNSGNRETINNRSGAPVEVTISTAPASYSRIDLIVAYVNPNPTGDGTSTDNPTACGIIAVAGSPAATPVAPNDTAIRSAITTDGGTGAGAFYVILASITVGANVTTIGSGVITQGVKAAVDSTNLPWTAMPIVDTKSTTQATVTTSWSNLYSFSVADFPTGAKIAVIATVDISTSTATGHYARLSYAGSTGFESSMHGQWDQTLTVIGVITKSASYSTAYIQGQVGSDANGAWGCQVIAFRIA